MVARIRGRRGKDGGVGGKVGGGKRGTMLSRELWELLVTREATVARPGLATVDHERLTNYSRITLLSIPLFQKFRRFFF